MNQEDTSRNPDGTFKKGNKGRPKGSRNKLTQKELDELHKSGHSIVEALLYLAQHAKSEKIKVQCYSKLLDFLNNKDLNTINDDDKPELNLDREALLLALSKELDK